MQGNVYMLVGAGGNITISAGPDGVLLVDTGLAQISDQIAAAIRKISSKPILRIGGVYSCGPDQIADEATGWPVGYVPHHLPGTNEQIADFISKHGIPAEAARGGPQTMYPEFLEVLKRVSDSARRASPTLSAIGADPMWGQWLLNRAKSTFSGNIPAKRVMKFEAVASGVRHIIDTQVMANDTGFFRTEYTASFDGKDVPIDDDALRRRSNRDGHNQGFSQWRCVQQRAGVQSAIARWRYEMRKRVLEVLGAIGLILAVIVLLKLAPVSIVGEAPKAAPAAKTLWGEPDLQGIWTDDFQTPLQRPARYASKEFFTDAERTELDKQRAGILRRDQRVERGSERDVAGAYNAVFQSIKHTGKRTSLVVDPLDGRIPPLTPEAKKRNEAEREFRLALLQATETCKKKDAACAGGKYGPPSPRRAELPPLYNTGRLNRNNGPEDRSMSERCMAAVLPDFGGFRRIVQSPGVVSIFYDTGQGQGWQRIIPVDGSPHIPSHIRRWWGDSRGRWEGNTLVVDVIDFTPKLDFQGSRENLHLVERWTRLNTNTLEYAVTIDDPTTWTRPWTVKQEMNKQNEQANRLYYEPRCHEGNYGLPALLAGARVEEKAFADGRGPDPATNDTATDFGVEGGVDPLAGAGG